MKSIGKWIIFIILAGAFLAAGYWWGTGNPSTLVADSPGDIAAAGKTRGKVLYYRNPMGHADTSSVPKKDPMGMDYIPVYEGEEPLSGDSAVNISVEKIQKLGVKTEAAAVRELTRTVRAVARVQADERRLYTIAPRFEGWIERLHVNATGQPVKKGDLLMEVYSPELITAQHEYLIAKKGMQRVESASLEVQAQMEQLAESALQRLRNFDISEADLKVLQQKGEARHSVRFRSPVSGVVLEKPAIQGQRFVAGEMLYQIADLSSVWMVADVFEQDVAMVRRGQDAIIQVDAYPEKVFNGEVTFIHPTVNPETRTAKVRIELPNPQGLLKPAMYGRAELVTAAGKEKVLAVPDSAVLNTGTQQLVLIDLGEGRFEPREVKLGRHADNYAEILHGLTAGDRVVVKANFLIDAESNLRAALDAFDQNDRSSLSGGPEKKQQSGTGSSTASSPVQIHRGEGTIEAIDPTGGAVTLAHEPIAALAWPSMRMDFKVRDHALLRTLKPGDRIKFEMTEEPEGYVIVRIERAEAAPANPGSGKPGQRRN